MFVIYIVFYITDLMHNYNINNRYKTSTRQGNWYEQKQLNDYNFKEYLYQKETNQNLTINTNSKLAFSNQNFALTQAQDHSLRRGDVVQFFAPHTKGVLAFNVNEAILGEETYAVTSSPQHQPALRNAFTVEPVSDTGSDLVCYGDQIRLSCRVGDNKVYLQSLTVSPMRSSKFSRLQQVSVTTSFNGYSLWTIERVNAKERGDSVGSEVQTNQPVLLKHVLTSQWLANQNVKYINDFGVEFQVFAKSFLANNKTQNLFAQKVGHRAVDNPLRNQGIQNEWYIVRG